MREGGGTCIDYPCRIWGRGKKLALIIRVEYEGQEEELALIIRVKYQ